MNLLLLKHSESPLAALWQTPILPQCVFFSFLRGGLCLKCARSLCLQSATRSRWQSGAATLAFLEVSPVITQDLSQSDQPVLAHFFWSVLWLSSTRLSAPWGVLVLPNLEARKLDSRRVRVLLKLCPPSTKLWAPEPVQFFHINSSFNLLCILSCRTLVDGCVTLQIVSSGLNSPKMTPVKTENY